MTGILSMSYGGSPVLIGDIIIVSARPPQHPLMLPASGQNAADTPIWWGTHFVTDFRQKLNLIGPHMIVAWAGVRAEARAVVSHLRREYQNVDESDFDQLRALSESVDELGVKETSFICVVTGDQMSSTTLVGDDVRLVNTPWGEDGFVAGTGEDQFVDVLSQIYNASGHAIYNQAIVCGLHAASKLWFRDINGISTELAFGGAYEVVGIKDQQLSKVDNVLYSYFRYDEQGLGVTPIFKKVDYYQDCMIIRVVDYLSAAETGSIVDEIPRVAIYSVPPVDVIHHEPKPEEILENIPDFNASHFVTHVNVQPTSPDKSPFSFAVHKHVVGGSPMQFFSENNYTSPAEFQFDPGYIKHIEDSVLEKLADASETH